ncbi:MAG: acylneuraminate cytidylyltransferase family protein, partial [Acidimicrobiia bacterium]
MSVAGLLPMKGHSERVPGKNMRVIAGKPLFHWVTETQLA